MAAAREAAARAPRQALGEVERANPSIWPPLSCVSEIEPESATYGPARAAELRFRSVIFASPNTKLFSSVMVASKVVQVLVRVADP